MVRDEIRGLFGEFMKIPADVDWSEVKYQETEGWDSLAHMALVGEIEDRFEIMLETDDVIDMSSFDIALEILKKYGVAVES